MRGEAFDVDLVDDELPELEVRRLGVLPVEGVVDNDGLRDNCSVVAPIRRPLARPRLWIVGEKQVVSVPELTRHGFGVWIEEQLRFVEPQPPFRAIFAANFVAIELP